MSGFPIRCVLYRVVTVVQTVSGMMVAVVIAPRRSEWGCVRAHVRPHSAALQRRPRDHKQYDCSFRINTITSLPIYLRAMYLHRFFLGKLSNSTKIKASLSSWWVGTLFYNIYLGLQLVPKEIISYFPTLFLLKRSKSTLYRLMKITLKFQLNFDFVTYYCSCN